MTILYVRFRLFRFGMRICDVIGGPIDAVLSRTPWVKDQLCACDLLHGVTFTGDVPDAWWDR